jgi:SAM-dependent methyltransferase
MTSVRGAADGLAAAGGLAADAGLAADGGSRNTAGTQAAGWTSAAGARTRAAHAHGDVSDLFARSVRDFATARADKSKPVKLLQAGCTGPIDDLALDTLQAGKVEVSVRSIDQDHPLTRKAAAAAGHGTPSPVVLGDLRTIPLPAREFGVVYCAHLLDRIPHAELVLDRLVAALQPGGLLLLRLRDRESAAGLLDRILPLAARRAIWHWLRPQQAGPFPAVYEPLLSAAGVHSYVLSRGLVIAERQALRDRPRRPSRPAWGAPLACRLIAALSRGRRADDHDDLLYVIRKPESHFARVL